MGGPCGEIATGKSDSMKSFKLQPSQKLKTNTLKQAGDTE